MWGEGGRIVRSDGGVPWEAGIGADDAAGWQRHERRYRAGLVATLAVMLLAAGILGSRIDRQTARRPEIDAVLYLPSGAYLQQIALGYQQAWADLLWLRTIGYYADQANNEHQFTYLYRMLDVITTLDPKFLYPYLFGGVTLSIELDRPDLANRLLHKGMRHHPDVWKIPFLIGFNTYFGEGDAATAARYIALAGRLPGAPGYLPGFAARLYVRGSGREKALAFLSEVIGQTEDPALRAQLIRRYQQIEQGIVKGPAAAFPRTKESP